MFNSEKKNSRFARQKKNILTLVLSEKKFLSEKKTIPPPTPLQVKRSVPNTSGNSNVKVEPGWLNGVKVT